MARGSAQLERTSYSFFSIPPGDHRICVAYQSRLKGRSETAGAASLTAEAGNVYYLRVLSASNKLRPETSRSRRRTRSSSNPQPSAPRRRRNHSVPACPRSQPRRALAFVFLWCPCVLNPSPLLISAHAASLRSSFFSPPPLTIKSSPRPLASFGIISSYTCPPHQHIASPPANASITNSPAISNAS